MGQVVRDGHELIAFSVEVRLVAFQPGHLAAGEHGVETRAGDPENIILHRGQRAANRGVSFIQPHDRVAHGRSVPCYREDGGALGSEGERADQDAVLPCVAGMVPQNGEKSVFPVPRVLLRHTVAEIRYAVLALKRMQDLAVSVEKDAAHTGSPNVNYQNMAHKSASPPPCRVFPNYSSSPFVSITC